MASSSRRSISLSNGGAAAAAAFALIAACGCTSALADEYPARKPGLWEVILQPDARSGRPAMGAVQQCVDANTDKLMRDMGSGMSKRDCAKQDLRHEGANMVVDTVCRMDVAGNATTATTHSTISGSFDTAYHIESQSSYDPPFMGVSKGSMTMDARWTGPCKADQKPGDMVMPNGMKINVLDGGGGMPGSAKRK